MKIHFGLGLGVVLAAGVLWLAFRQQRPVEDLTIVDRVEASLAVVDQPVRSVERAAAPVPAIQLDQDSELAVFVAMDQPLDKRIPSDISARFPSVASGPEMDAVVAVLLNIADHDTVRNEAANLPQRSNYPQLADSLLRVLDSPHEKPRFRAFATQHLGGQLTSGSTAVRARVDEKLHQLLDDKDVEVRREALFALAGRRYLSTKSV